MSKHYLYVRLFISILGGLFIPILLFGALSLAMSVSTDLFWPWVLLLSWPEYLLSRYITPDNVIPLMLFSLFIGYSLLTYLILWLRDRLRSPKLPWSNFCAKPIVSANSSQTFPPVREAINKRRAKRVATTRKPAMRTPSETTMRSKTAFMGRGYHRLFVHEIFFMQSHEEWERKTQWGVLR